MNKSVKSKMSAEFELKSALRKYADGGQVRLPQQAPQVAPPNVPPDTTDRIWQVVGLRNGGYMQRTDRYNQTGSPVAMANGGRACSPRMYGKGGEVDGPGGPRDDMVPAMLSDGEYVLPAKTVRALGGPDALDHVVRHTNDGREPGARMIDGVRHHARGGMPDPLDNVDLELPKYNPSPRPAPAAPMGGPNVAADWLARARDTAANGLRSSWNWTQNTAVPWARSAVGAAANTASNVMDEVVKPAAQQGAQRVAANPRVGDAVRAATELPGKVAPAVNAARSAMGAAGNSITSVMDEVVKPAAQQAAQRVMSGGAPAAPAAPASAPDAFAARRAQAAASAQAEMTGLRSPPDQVIRVDGQGRAMGPRYDGPPRPNGPQPMPSSAAQPRPMMDGVSAAERMRPPPPQSAAAGSAPPPPPSTRGGRLAARAGRAARFVAGPGAVGAAGLTGFNDLEAYDPATGKSIDDSGFKAPRAGFVRAANEMVGGVAGTVDSLAGLAGYKPDLQKKFYDSVESDGNARKLTGVGLRRRNAGTDRMAEGNASVRASEAAMPGAPSDPSYTAAENARFSGAAVAGAMQGRDIKNMPRDTQMSLLPDGAKVQDTGVGGIRRVNAPGQAPMFTNFENVGAAYQGLQQPQAKQNFQTMDLRGYNADLARANAERQRYLDSLPVPSSGGSARGEERDAFGKTAAERDADMDRFNQSVQSARMSGFVPSGLRAQQLAATNNAAEMARARLSADTARRGQDMDYSLGVRRDFTTQRGQDLGYAGDRMRDQVTMRGQNFGLTEAQMRDATTREGLGVDLYKAEMANRLAATRLGQEMAQQNAKATQDLLGMHFGPLDKLTPEDRKRAVTAYDRIMFTTAQAGIPLSQLNPQMQADLMKAANDAETTDMDNATFFKWAAEKFGFADRRFVSRNLRNYTDVSGFNPGIVTDDVMTGVGPRGADSFLRGREGTWTPFGEFYGPWGPRASLERSDRLDSLIQEARRKE